MTKRINVILPDATVAALDRVAPKGSRSRLISQAVLHYVQSQSSENLKESLKQGYLANAAHDLEIDPAWFSLEEQAWQKVYGKKKKK
jgi:metal-responsive CopG/Arc/MetJ family transcriptional regulator